ncbi:helix-turn-helix DNA binding domain protein [Gordonia phage Malachai]|nr:helix-turn-helix DNA binding protein [Gordonia phage Begonia]UVF60473.1 helix-turn-helix DNA binding domain protein [Gordonia phage Malachai]
MPKETQTRRYTRQRNPKVPPHISLGVLRRVSGLKLDDVCDQIEDITGDRPTKGALSAIENGHRGASLELIAALEMVYGLHPGDITTNYVPRNTPQIALGGEAV